MSEASSGRAWYRSDVAFIGALALIKLALHLVYNRWYGFHQDEFYFIACGEHLSFGYVDHPPMVPWIARLSMEVFGPSLTGLRFLPAVFGALGLFITGLLARRLGGGRYAQLVACLAFLIAPVFMRAQNILAIPAFEPFYWVLCSYLVVRIIQENNPKLWLWVGVVAGFGLMNKHTMAFFGLGLAAGIVLTPLRKDLKSPYLWAGGAIALLIFLPNLIWQYTHGWPTLEFIRKLNEGTMSRIGTVEFLLGQVLYLHVANVFVWIPGLIFFMFMKDGKSYRILGWIYLIVLALLLVAKSKIYYLAPAYPALMAGGGVALEHWWREKPWRVMRPVFATVMVVLGVVFIPVSLPVMNVQSTDRYITAVSMGLVENAFELTGDLHAMFGWPEVADGLAEVYESLSPEEQEKAFLYGRSYSIAGAIDFYGPAHNLPNAYSGHLTYWMWGPPPNDKTIMIAVGSSVEGLKEYFGSVEVAKRVNPNHGLEWYRNMPITVCRDPKYTASEMWPRIRSW